ncbi:Aminopeptidase N [Filimonas lacunae]|uniref:Aminopeptidase N n=2 Tax=Filimonas lacunae TaxID=477680 RepID=A0A1N7R0K9_9BACT|nr:Aminopeptidase N [Filimonas lacunae]
MASLGFAVQAQNIQNNPGSNHGNDFEQLGTILPTPNSYRTASGAAGPDYWQQRADYKIKCKLDETATRLTGSETITYFNNSPDPLTYLWLQLDENQHSASNNAGYQKASNLKTTNLKDLDELDRSQSDDSYGVNILSITDATGKKLSYTINKTMMRIDLPATLAPHQQYVFNVNWNYKISDRMRYGGRGGYEYFPGDGNILFTMTQWYPRLCVYSDFQGWQNHQFAGSGEFALTFGNFNVEITVPADHIVGSTGECQNYAQVLNSTRLARWQKAQTSKEPVEIVTLAEATQAEKQKATTTKTWIFKADNVRDFAWTSSRKFVWDALATTVEKKKVMCMSFYGKEAYNLYRKFSTKAVAHTIQSYSKFTIPYPYPVAQSIEAANGMEYPMICFNYGRTEKDGTYTEATKNGMIGVIIHEVGHNFFPMIVNSDERQWTWMDEGLNTFTQYLAEELWDNKFPSRRGPAWAITDYMKLPKNELEPIMTNSENIIQFGPNAYSKPATGLNILRETIMGRKLFDYAYKEYARRWAFKHPTPADLFRTLEDASGEDLDWFWRGWFYGTDPCDISLDSVKGFQIGDGKKVTLPEPKSKTVKLEKPLVPEFDDISKIRNRQDSSIHFLVDADTTLQDFYYKYDRGVIPYDSTFTYQKTDPAAEPLDDSTSKKYAGRYLYELSFTNKGGLVMPVIIEWTYTDGTKETEKIPAQIWRKDEKHFDKVFLKNKAVSSIQLDPLRETADIDVTNNQWPQAKVMGRFEVFKSKQATRGQSQGMNPMQKQ